MNTLRYVIPVWDPSVKDWAIEARILRWLTFIWLMIGLVVLFSSSYIVADAEYGNGLHYFRTQLLWIAIGLVGFNILVNAPLRYILGIADWLVLLFLGLIILTHVPGIGATVNGATRWLVIGPFSIQPSEFVKPCLVLQSARIFGQWPRFNWATRLSWLGIFLVILFSVLLQPNLSTAALCGMVIWLVAFASGLPYSYLLGSACSGIAIALISIASNPYQWQRIVAFLDPWADPTQNSYQLVQSLMAVGSGGFWGTGFGLSQQKLFYLPIQYTDFIFSVYAEEFGFIGSVLLLGLLGAYATMGLRVSLHSRRPVHRLVAIGMVVLLVGQALLNVGVATGALPTTGLPFPMFSYGGSSMLSSLGAASLLIRVARESREADVVTMPIAAI